MLLNSHNYKEGFLISDDYIAGVTEMADGLYAAYISHHLTGETLAYQEFEAVQPALSFLSELPYKWSFEAVGCSAHTTSNTKKAAASCGVSSGGGCSSCSCK